jgi:hypothetical protein
VFLLRPACLAPLCTTTVQKVAVALFGRLIGGAWQLAKTPCASATSGALARPGPTNFVGAPLVHTIASVRGLVERRRRLALRAAQRQR